MLKKGKKVLKKGCVFLLVMLAMCLVSNLAFSDIKEGARPGEKNPVASNRNSLFCDDELLMLVGFNHDHKMDYISFTPQKADLTEWSTETSEHTFLDTEYAYLPGQYTAARGRIVTKEHDDVVYAYIRSDRRVAVERWSNGRDPLYVTLDVDTPWSEAAVDVAVANLDLFVDDNRYDPDEIVVARTKYDGTVLVDVLDYNFNSLGSVSVVPANRKSCMVAVAVGDFCGDGNLEFAVAQTDGEYDYKIDIFRFTRDGNPSLEKISTLSDEVVTVPIEIFEMTAGDFIGGGKDAIALSYATKLELFEVDDDLNLQKRQTYSDADWQDYRFMVSGLFKFDPENGYDIGRRQLAISSRDGSAEIHIGIYAVKGNWDVELIGEHTEVTGEFYKNLDSLTAGNFIGHDSELPLMDIAFSYREYNLAKRSGRPNLKILGLREDTLQEIYTWNGDYYGGDSLMRTMAVAYDKDGDTYRLGPPAHITIENLLGLNYVIQEPPKHVDYLPTNPFDPENEWEWDVINVSAYQDFYVEFKDEQSQTVATETKNTSSRTTGKSSELDVKTTVEAGFGDIAKVSVSAEYDKKIGYEYNSSKSSYESEYGSRTVSYSSQTNTDDALHCKLQLFDIWRYPIYGLYDTGDENNPHVFQEIILPGPKLTFCNYGLDHADWYQPVHQNRNILSYPSLKDENFPSDLGSFTLPNGTAVTEIMNEGAVRSWSGNAQTINVKWTEEAGSGDEKTYNHTLSESEDLSIRTSAKASCLYGSAEVDAGVKLSRHNTNSWGGSTTENATNSGSTGILINIPAGGTSNQAYNFRSAIYVSSGGGVFKVAHATDPLGSTSGWEWWQKQYGVKPDPALNLPNRFEWDPDIVDWILVDNISRKRMRGFFLRESEHSSVSGEYEILGEMLTAGDVVRVCARVYNFSTSKSTGEFSVRFEYVPYDSEDHDEIDVPRVLIGNAFLSLAPLEMEEVHVDWDTTGLDVMTAGDLYRLYVTVDPNNQVDEIHEWKEANGNLLAHGNNEGYWPWANGIIIASEESMAGMAISGVDISMHDESLAVKMPAGIVSQGPVSLTVGGHYMLRSHFVSNALHPHYRYALLYDGNPNEGGEVIASTVVRGVVEGDNYIWTEWTPKEPGDYELWVALLEDSDDPNRGNASDMLSVSVSQPMACCEVNFMKAADKKQGRSDDKINIKGSLKLVEWGESFEPEIDVVCVTIDDQVITIPAGSFEAEHTSGLIQYGFKGDIPDVGHVHMRLNFDECSWSIDIRGKDAADIVQNNGASVGLTIGTNVGEDSFEWTKKTKSDAIFNEAPPLLCCPDSH